MNGKTVNHGSLTPIVLQLLSSRDGIMLMKSVQQQMGTCILFDRQNLTIRIFGPENQAALTEKKLVASLLAFRDKQQTDICLWGGAMPNDLVKKVVEKFGPELLGLKEKLPEAELMLNTSWHVISFTGKKDLRLRVEEMIHNYARSVSVNRSVKRYEGDNIACPICLYEFEDCYQLQACGHKFCQSCLVGNWAETCLLFFRPKNLFSIENTWKTTYTTQQTHLCQSKNKKSIRDPKFSQASI